MTQEMKTKRAELKALSRPIEEAVKNGKYNTINEGLAAYYKQQGHTELHSYKQWKERGFQVKRGEKALLFWGEPLKNDSKPDTDENKFFPLAFVFSQTQVYPIETAEMRR